MEDASEGPESEGPVPMEAEPTTAAAKGKRKVKRTEVPFTASQVRVLVGGACVSLFTASLAKGIWIVNGW